MKKLIPAFVLLLISAVVMSTASFAWFSMNKTVTATGMEIKAAVSDQLMIKGSAASAVYKSEIDFGTATDSAFHDKNTPASVPAVAYKLRATAATAALLSTAASWQKLTEAGMKKINDVGAFPGGSAYTDAGMATGAVAGTDYIKDSFSLKRIGAEGTVEKNIGMTLTITTNSTTGTPTTAVLFGNGTGEDQIYKAVHVAFVDNSTTAVFYEIDLDTATVSADKSTLTITDEDFVANAPTDYEKTWTMYIWYDGEDTDCYNTVAKTIANLQFSLSFTVAE